MSAVILTGCDSRHDTVEERVNILFIIADDASRASMSIYGSGYIKTPNFDRLAHDISRDDGAKLAVGYPVRGIRTKHYLYSRNYEPQRWPPGSPEHGFRNSDDGPTEDYLVSVSENGDFRFQNSLNPDYKFYELCFSFRPEEEFYDMKKDPDCINNLGSFPQCREAMDNLASKLQNELIKQKDPRALGNSAIFDT